MTLTIPITQQLGLRDSPPPLKYLGVTTVNLKAVPTNTISGEICLVQISTHLESWWHLKSKKSSCSNQPGRPPSSAWSGIAFKLMRKLSASPRLSGCLPEVFKKIDGVSFSEVNIYHLYSILSIKGKTGCHRYCSKTNTWQSWTPNRSLEATDK